MDKFRYSIIGIFLQFCLVVNISGQTISGTVVSELSEPLVGVSISIPHTNIGTVTDYNGNYSITIDSKYNTLRYCFIGHECQEVTIRKDTIVNISLEESPIKIDDIIVFGPRIEIRKRGHFQLKKIKKNGWFHKPDTIIIGIPDSTFNRIETERIRKIKDSINTYIVPKIIPKLNDSINFTNEPLYTKFSIAERTFRKYLVNSIEYPEKALNDNIEGTIYAKFTINE